ncbi:Heme-binding protein A [subsurface metagenome]
MNVLCDRLMTGGMEEYGPKGANLYDWRSDWYLPEKYVVGCLAESWEITADKLVFHIRPGVYWSGMSINPVMEAREVTAEDLAFNLNRILEGPDGEGTKAGAGIVAMDWVESIYDEDTHTLVIETKYYNPAWFIRLYTTGWNFLIAPESIEAGPEEWENIVGTGPFVLTERSPGVSLTYEPNPLYWRKTTINGKEYQIPFVDKLVLPVIKDEATVMAAVRTGVIDHFAAGTWVYAGTLAKTNPEILQVPCGLGGLWGVCIKCNKPPFDDKDVRRAVVTGTDLDTISRTAIGREWELHWPTRGEGHVELEELSPELRAQYEYDPETAREMLAEAGYPDGFPVKLVTSNRFPVLGSIAELLASQWERDLSVDVEIEVIDSSIFWPVTQEREAEWDLWLEWHGAHNAIHDFSLHYLTDAAGNFNYYSNPAFDEKFNESKRMFDAVDREKLEKEESLMLIEASLCVPFPYHFTYTFYWPWIKNYHGELYEFMRDPPYEFWWIDQELKAEMGY